MPSSSWNLSPKGLVLWGIWSCLLFLGEELPHRAMRTEMMTFASALELGQRLPLFHRPSPQHGPRNGQRGSLLLLGPLLKAAGTTRGCWHLGWVTLGQKVLVFNMPQVWEVIRQPAGFQGPTHSEAFCSRRRETLEMGRRMRNRPCPSSGPSGILRAQRWSSPTPQGWQPQGLGPGSWPWRVLPHGLFHTSTWAHESPLTSVGV